MAWVFFFRFESSAYDSIHFCNEKPAELPATADSGFYTSPGGTGPGSKVHTDRWAMLCGPITASAASCMLSLVAKVQAVRSELQLSLLQVCQWCEKTLSYKHCILPPHLNIYIIYLKQRCTNNSHLLVHASKCPSTVISGPSQSHELRTQSFPRETSTWITACCIPKYTLAGNRNQKQSRNTRSSTQMRQDCPRQDLNHSTCIHPSI